MENILKYIISFRCGSSYNYFSVLMDRGILKLDDEGYYLDAELFDYKFRDIIELTDKLYELYGIEIKRIWRPNGFYYIHTYKRI